MENKILELESAITKAEVCAEKLSHLVENFSETYSLHDTAEMSDLSASLFACKKSGMRIDSEIMEDYANELKTLLLDVREVARA